MSKELKRLLLGNNGKHYAKDVRQTALSRIDAKERACDVARSMRLPVSTVYAWVSDRRKCREEYEHLRRHKSF